MDARAEQLHEEFLGLVSGGMAAGDVSRAAKGAAARGPLTAYVARVAAAHESL